MTGMSIWRFGALCGVAGGLIASALAGGWYSPLVFEYPVYGSLLTALSNVFWPSTRMIGGWVGSWEPATYWLRVAVSILANAAIYEVAGALGLMILRWFKAHRAKDP
jgi:hypothetical protein